MQQLDKTFIPKKLLWILFWLKCNSLSHNTVDFIQLLLNYWYVVGFLAGFLKDLSLIALYILQQKMKMEKEFIIIFLFQPSTCSFVPRSVNILVCALVNKLHHVPIQYFLDHISYYFLLTLAVLSKITPVYCFIVSTVLFSHLSLSYCVEMCLLSLQAENRSYSCIEKTRESTDIHISIVMMCWWHREAVKWEWLSSAN